jgi:hypothetical protein
MTGGCAWGIPRRIGFEGAPCDGRVTSCLAMPRGEQGLADVPRAHFGAIQPM